MTGPDLPPRPHPVSGDPRPPRAPMVVGPWAGQPTRRRRTATWHPGRDQRWFTRHEPILELAQAGRPRPWRHVAAYPLLCGAGLALLAGLWLLVGALRTPDYPLGDNAAAMAVIVVLVTAGYLGLRYLQQRTQVVYAGAAWLGDGEGRAQCVGTYDLARIAVTGTAQPAATLTITGADQVALQLPFGLLEANPALWDYLYNGLRHSAAAGAEVDPTSRTFLALPGPPPRRATSEEPSR